MHGTVLSLEELIIAKCNIARAGKSLEPGDNDGLKHVEVVLYRYRECFPQSVFQNQRSRPAEVDRGLYVQNSLINLQDCSANILSQRWQKC